ncbi:hypothetical protein F511_45364 [Dorcoceras hygrometricum]|uniref:Uncharacterized protein n=1 Tax=Dorcoceras hygrometricum TaxID=472368 RepID=A0A2Z6ZW70_9LAMI|nr:hypothetical protein F511_45364 [Dorcoceras hygrometricum]
MATEKSTSYSGAMIMLTATNYTLWIPGMEDLFSCKDLFDPIEAKGKNPDPAKELEWKKSNRKTIGQIRQWIDHSVFHHVAQETDAYALWKKLEDMYQAKTARNKALLMRRLVNMKLKNGTSVAEHTSEYQSLVNQLSSVEMPLGDEMQALLLLSSLPDSWETLVVSLSNSAPDGKLTMSMIKDACSTKRPGGRTWAPIRPMPLSQRTKEDNKWVTNGEAGAGAGADPLMAENLHINVITVE